MKKILLILLSSIFITACGGGGQDSVETLDFSNSVELASNSASPTTTIGTNDPADTVVLPTVADDDLLGHLLAEETDPLAREFLARGINRGGASIKHPCTAVGDGFTGARYLVFHSSEALVPGDSNNKDDIYLRDNLTGCLTRVSVGPDNVEADGNSHEATISQDGRYIAFRSAATNLVASDGNGTFDIFLRDLQAGTTTRISESTSGGDANGTSYVPEISADGEFVVFATAATDIVSGDTNGQIDIIRYEIDTGNAERVNLTAAGAQLTAADSADPSISPNGNFVVFSSADNTLPNANGQRQIYIRDISGATTELVSALDGTSTAGNSHSQCPIVGGTEAAPLVSFLSTATDLVTGDTNDSYDVFVRDIAADTTNRVSVDSSGNEGNSHSAFNSIDQNGNVAFASLASNLNADDTDTTPDVFFYNASDSSVSLLSRADGASGTKGDQDTDMVALHFDGTACAMRSVSTNLESSDTTIDDDVFLRNLTADTTDHTSNSFPESPNYLYAADQTNSTVFIYSVNNDGTLTTVGSQTGVTSATHLAAHLVGDYLFVTGGGASSSWSIDASTGNITFTDNGLSGNFTKSLGDPSGRWVHSIGASDDSVAGTRLNELGALIETLPAGVDGGDRPSDLVYHPGGCYLYVCNETDATISAYTVSDSGSLTEIQTPASSSAEPVALAMHPEGTALYVGCNAGGSGLVQAFSIDANDGSLTSLGTASMVSGGLVDVVIDPRGQNVYAANAVDQITHFTVDAGLTLTQDTEYDVDGTTNSVPAELLIDPSSSYLYVAGSATDSLYSLTINGTSGVLTALETVPTGNSNDSLLSIALVSPVLPPWGYGVGPQLASLSLQEEVATIVGEDCEMAAPASFVDFTLDVRRFLKDWTSSVTGVATADGNAIFTGVSTGSFVAEATEPVTGIRPSLSTQARTNINFRVSQNTSGGEPDDESFLPEISGDGRYIVYQSFASDIVSGDTNFSADIFCYDLKTGETELISFNTSGGVGNGDSGSASISGDGRYIAFESEASDLVASDTNGEQDIFLYDRVTNTIERINLDINDLDANDTSSDPAITADGRYIVYESDANDLVTGDINGEEDCFLYDRVNGTTERISLNLAGTGGGDGESSDPDISDDGRYIVYESRSTDLVAVDGNAEKDVFLYDRNTTTTHKISLDTALGDTDGASFSVFIAGDGSRIVYASEASDLVASDGNGVPDIFAITTTAVVAGTGGTEKITRSTSGGDADGPSIFASISSDGDRIALDSIATNMAATDGDTLVDVYLFEVSTSTMRHLVLDETGGKPNADTVCSIVSPDGRWVTFVSVAFDLISGDTGVPDVFLTPVDCRL